MALTLHEDYWHDSDRKAAFCGFLADSFRLDLSLWDSCGYWDDAYRPFTLFDDGDIASSLCLYTMNMTVNGRRCLVGQFSAVATHPNYRRRGLSARLTQRALQWAAETHDFFFLFANREAFPFYRSCGFTPAMEYKTRLTVDGRRPVPGAVLLSMDNVDHRNLVYRYAVDRTPVSNILGVHNPRLLMFWCLYGLRNDIYRIPDLDVVVLCRREDSLLKVYDVVGRRLPSFDKILPYITGPEISTVEFQFMPDRMNLPSPGTLVPFDENGMHLMGTFPLLNGHFLFPLTSHA